MYSNNTNTTNRRKIFTIIQHEYTTRVKSKGFIVATILGPIFMLLLIAIPAAVQIMSMDSTEKKLAVVDQTGRIGEKLVMSDTSKYFLVNESQESLQSKVNEGKLDGYVLLGSDFITTGSADVFTKGGGGIGFLSSLEGSLKSVLTNERLKDIGAAPEFMKLIEKGVTVKTQKVTEKGTEKDFAAASAAIGYVLGFLIYMMLLIYGAMVMRGVVEEKANRIVEVLASSARPMEIMMGKVIGIGAVGLTQVLFWVIMSALLFSVGVPILDSMITKPEMVAAGMQAQGSGINIMEIVPTSIDPWLIIGFFYYFLVGYFIYAALYAGIGSAVDQESDAQQLSTVITLPVIIPILLVGSIINNPDSTLAVIMSLIPFFTPIIMLVRVSSTDVPFWQIATSVVLTLLTLWGTLWAASRVYRIGILMYGTKPKLSDLIKWVRM